MRWLLRLRHDEKRKDKVNVKCEIDPFEAEEEAEAAEEVAEEEACGSGGDAEEVGSSAGDEDGRHVTKRASDTKREGGVICCCRRLPPPQSRAASAVQCAVGRRPRGLALAPSRRLPTRRKEGRRVLGTGGRAGRRDTAKAVAAPQPVRRKRKRPRQRTVGRRRTTWMNSQTPIPSSCLGFSMVETATHAAAAAAALETTPNGTTWTISAKFSYVPAEMRCIRICTKILGNTLTTAR